MRRVEKRASDPPERELQGFGSHLTWVLGPDSEEENERLLNH